MPIRMALDRRSNVSGDVSPLAAPWWDAALDFPCRETNSTSMRIIPGPLTLISGTTFICRNIWQIEDKACYRFENTHYPYFALRLGPAFE